MAGDQRSDCWIRASRRSIHAVTVQVAAISTGAYIRNGENRLSADVQLAVDFRLTDSNPFRALDQELTLDAEIYRLPWLRGF